VSVQKCLSLLKKTRGKLSASNLAASYLSNNSTLVITSRKQKFLWTNMFQNKHK